MNYLKEGKEKVDRFRQLEKEWDPRYSKIDIPMGEGDIAKLQKVITEKECKYFWGWRLF